MMRRRRQLSTIVLSPLSPARQCFPHIMSSACCREPSAWCCCLLVTHPQVLLVLAQLSDPCCALVLMIPRKRTPLILL